MRVKESKKMTPEEETRFYGIDLNGNLGERFIFMDFKSIGARYHDVKKKYILKDIEDLKMKVTMENLISLWRETGKSEWEAMLAWLFMRPLRVAWSEGKAEADITQLFKVELTALPTGNPGEKTITVNGNTYRVFDQEDVKKKILPFFEILEETDDTIYLKAKI